MVKKRHIRKPEDVGAALVESNATAQLERHVIGGLLTQGRWSDLSEVDQALLKLTDDDLTRSAHRLIIDIIRKLRKEGLWSDVNAVWTELETMGKLHEVGGATYLVQLCTEGAPVLLPYVKLLQRRTRQRKLCGAGAMAIEAGSNGVEPEEIAEELIRACQEVTASCSDHERNLSQLLAESVLSMGEKVERNTIPTGYQDIDRLTSGGLQKGDLTIIGARPGIGKTSLVLGMARNTASRGTRVGLVSLEMTAEQIIHRMIAQASRIENRRIRTGSLDQFEIDRVTRVVREMETYQIFVNDSSSMTVEELRLWCMTQQSRDGLDLVIVDHIGYMSASGADGPTDEVTKISRGLKQLAKDLGIAVLAVSQLARRPEHDNRVPELSDLRQSGALEQDAAHVWFIVRPGAYEETTPETGPAELWVKKQRLGPRGRVRLTFLAPYTLFESAEFDGPDWKSRQAGETR